ncbi:MAG: sigma-54 dependent transcriptional regulator [Bacteroidales bacterium]|jgi:DNA-binding NtrC family response regulator|nr:sigma-54 dependent transcriptional regulator [Bacteroidales bacterium]
MAIRDKIKILILDDEKQFTEELSGFFQGSDYESFEANTADEGKKILKNIEVDLLILDVRLPGVNGLDILKEVKVQYPGMEVIIISAHGDMDTVIKAMRLGAFDYLRKPFRYIDIQIAIERTQKYLQMQRRLKRMEERNSLISKTLEEKIDRQFIGVSPQIREVYEQATTAANYPDANVLITGESGTGKENIARIIHYSGPRKDSIFCAVNSSAISETLLESEIFGHKKGSFTGAVADKMGFFEACNGGTLFLDEIADMPLSLQAKILRATEEKVITRVGETNQIHTDFRIISATNHDIEKSIEKKKFRLDLLHRLNTLHIHIPPLRERPEDINPLLNHFADMYSMKFNKPNLHISKEVFNTLQKYYFPGNVRELRNMIERAIILCKGGLLGINDFPMKPQKLSASEEDIESIDLRVHEITLIRKALSRSKFNLQAASDALGIHRDALSRKMKKYNIKINRVEE